MGIGGHLKFFRTVSDSVNSRVELIQDLDFVKVIKICRHTPVTNRNKFITKPQLHKT